jgi:hypothetical protein
MPRPPLLSDAVAARLFAFCAGAAPMLSYTLHFRPR